jgi:Ca-activated chloride channel homolog
MQVNFTVSQSLSRACLAVLVFASLGHGQSVDDVHIAPRQKPSTDTPVVNVVVPIPGVPALTTHTKPIRSDVDLVLVPVTVTDAMNRPVITLKKQDFELYEGNKPQEVRYFFHDEAPLSVAVLLDVSRSMRDKIETERAALEAFFNNAHPQDEYFAFTFSDRPRLLATSTSSIDEIQHKLLSIEPGGPTAMLDAIYLAEAQLRTAKYKRRAIVIFSDGGDNVSHYSHREIRDLVREVDVEVYAIGLFENSLLETSFFGSLEEKLGKKWLSEITDATGGRTVTVGNRDKVPEAAASISREIRNQYVLGYRPALRGDGKWRKIKVRVAASTPEQPVHAFYKTGYISSQE